MASGSSAAPEFGLEVTGETFCNQSFVQRITVTDRAPSQTVMPFVA